MIRGLVGVALGWCLIVCANAQPLADVATNQELFAAYCVGVFTKAPGDVLLRDIEAALGRDGAQQTIEYWSQKRSRFLAYLTARGLLSGSRSISAVTGIRLATERGRADPARCTAKVMTCVENVMKRPYVQKDIDNCRDEEDACRKVARCNNDDQLPF